MLAKITIADYMTKNLLTLKKETSVLEAIKTTLSHKVTSAPVVDDEGKLIGMFSEKDAMKVILDSAYNRGMSGTVGEFMSTDIVTVDANASIVDLAERFQETSVRSFPVFNNNKLTGVVSRTDVLKALTSLK